MASCSCSCSTSLALPELNFISPRVSSRHRTFLSKQSIYRNSLYKNYPRFHLGGRNGIRAGKKDGSVVVEEKKESEVVKEINGLELNGNGTATRNSTSVNGINGYTNGSLVKYMNGNGGVAVEVVGEVEEEKVDKEDERKKKVEEIGKEEAWFKKSGEEKVKV